MTNWGPTGELVYQRTYSRTKPDGSREQWPETVRRVVDGNLALVPERHQLPNEREDLVRMMEEFKILPAGRHLWASGVKGRQYLFNCHLSGWSENVTDHFEFTFLRLMEGGGVGANYSNKYLRQYPEIQDAYQVHIVCDPEHPDFQAMKDAGVLSTDYDSEWSGSFEVEDSREGWAAALVDLVSTYYRQAENTNRVFDVSRVRAAGSRLKTFGGSASGPLPLAVMLRDVSDILWSEFLTKGHLTGIGAMEIDHAIAQCVVAGGNRRSARMAIMHWEDPQIWEFLQCKKDTGKHWTTNISVEVDEEFWSHIESDIGPEWADSVRVDIAEGMLTNGEPGIWDSSLSNEGEPNPVIATNPCGEIALEAWENCNLGHVNLGAFVNQVGTVDYLDLFTAHELMTRFLIRATFGDVNDPKQADTLARNRRIGVGHFGFAAFAAKLGIPYSETASSVVVTDVLIDCAHSVEAAASLFCHQLRIPVPVKTRTVAPTGTIAKLPGTTEGIHPVFARFFIRRIRLSTVDPDQVKTIEGYRAKGYHVEPCQYAANTAVISIPTKDSLFAEIESMYGTERANEIVQSASDLSLRDMLAVQAMYQEFWADNAVSYTANVDPEKYTVSDLTAVLTEFGGRLKGATVFPEMSRPQSPYERISEDEYNRSVIKEVSDSVDEECASSACPIR